MKNYLIIIIFLMQGFSLYSQMNIKKTTFIEDILETVKDELPPLFFTLKVRRDEREEYTVLINSRILFYSKFSHLNYSKEFPDTLRKILFKGIIEEKEFPTLAIHKINQKWYNKIERKNKTTRSVYNNYFSEINLPDGDKMAVLKNNIPVKKMSAVIAYMSNHFICVTGDSDGMPCIYVFKD